MYAAGGQWEVSSLPAMRQWSRSGGGCGGIPRFRPLACKACQAAAKQAVAQVCAQPILARINLPRSSQVQDKGCDS